MSDPRFAALLLAGGNSSRMGSPKALLDFGGEPLWRHQLAKLTALAPDELFISVPLDLAMPIGPWTLLHDAAPQLGPLAGLAAACQAMSADWLVVLAVDMPAITTNLLLRLRDHALHSGRGCVPMLDGYYIGLVATYPLVALQSAASQLRESDRSLQKLIKKGVSGCFIDTLPIGEDERHLFADINYWTEYLRVRNPVHESR